MKCVVCHSPDIERRTIDETFQVESDIVLVPVELLVCNNCGERYYDRRTMRRLEEFVFHVFVLTPFGLDDPVDHAILRPLHSHEVGIVEFEPGLLANVPADAVGINSLLSHDEEHGFLPHALVNAGVLLPPLQGNDEPIVVGLDDVVLSHTARVFLVHLVHDEGCLDHPIFYGLGQMTGSRSWKPRTSVR